MHKTVQVDHLQILYPAFNTYRIMPIILIRKMLRLYIIKKKSIPNISIFQ